MRVIQPYFFIIGLLLSGCFFGLRAQAPIKNSLFADNYQIDTEGDPLRLSIENLSFFKNNETDGDIFDGYSLPGFRLNPRLIYQPFPVVRLEAGISMLRFWGADKYPCYSYQHISEWKADGYQYGFHVLPFFRAQIQPIKQVNIVLGTIYNGDNHRVIEPLYNPELNLTADPECGAQLLYNARIAHADIWINWESFTFKNDVHHEAFTVGGSAALNITPETAFFHWSIPAQVLALHIGGELDTTGQDVTTMINGAAGMKFQFNFNRGLKNISLQSYGCMYDSPFNPGFFYSKGWGLYSAISAQIRNLNLKASHWRSRDFINVFGNPVYENLSLTLDGRVFPRTEIFNGGFSYEQTFGNEYHVGIDANFYYNPRLVAYDSFAQDISAPLKTSKSVNYSFGVYIRINPTIILNKKKL
ncbi:MAG: hypothetical protein LBR67_10515 [Dysgonamonadaceae bacterium]|nr:hypothetical protein [Dysgonamonadaceae bacterium]